MTKPERTIVRENSPEATFHLHIQISRHGEKAVADNTSQAADLVAPLTEKGRSQALTKGKTLDMKGARSMGSKRARSRETALLITHAHDENVSGAETFEELIQKVEKKPRVSEKLDMPIDKDDPEFPAINQLLIEKWYLIGIAEMDDELKKNGGDRGASVYGIQAYNIASLIEWYARASSKMADRIERAKRNGKQANTEHKIMMGTHAGVTESFLAEVVRYTVGEDARKVFLQTVPNGVGVVEGASIDITAPSGGEDPKVRIAFEVGEKGKEFYFNDDVPLSVIKKIIQDFSPKEKKS